MKLYKNGALSFGADSTSTEGYDSPNKCPRYDTKLHLMVKLKSCSFGKCEYPFIAILAQLAGAVEYTNCISAEG